jgi:membrane-bound lytic murein transglycosylase B
MQFMPPTWEAYGVDANGDGQKDPFNPVDAIFAAARYLRAAGADHDL